MTNKVFDAAAEQVTAALGGESAEFSVQYSMEDTYTSERTPMATWHISLSARTFRDVAADYDEDQIGRATLHLIDTDGWDHDEAFEAMDAYSEDLLRVYEGTESEWGSATRIAVVDRVEIVPQFRGLGLGPMLAVEALSRLGLDQMDSIAVLEVGDTGWADKSERETKAVVKKNTAAWKRAGFTRVETPEIEGVFMVLRAEDISVSRTESRVLRRLAAKRRA